MLVIILEELTADVLNKILCLYFIVFPYASPFALYSLSLFIPLGLPIKNTFHACPKLFRSHTGFNKAFTNLNDFANILFKDPSCATILKVFV